MQNNKSSNMKNYRTSPMEETVNHKISQNIKSSLFLICQGWPMKSIFLQFFFSLINNFDLSPDSEGTGFLNKNGKWFR